MSTSGTPAPSASERSSVVFPVPGGPSRMTLRPADRAAATTSASRRRATTRSRATRTMPPTSSRAAAVVLSAVSRSVVVDDDAAQVLAVVQVLVALVDVVERVAGGDQLVEL